MLPARRDRNLLCQILEVIACRNPLVIIINIIREHPAVAEHAKARSMMRLVYWR